MEELKPLPSQQKSFHGKAKYYRDGWDVVLISYESKVARYNMLEDKLYIDRIMSNTTLRHIIAFASQVLKVDIKNKEELEDYMNSTPHRFGRRDSYE